MHLIRFSARLVLGTALMFLVPAFPVVAQEREAGQSRDKLEVLNASYQEQLRAIERRWIAGLTALAEQGSALEADAAYRQLFALAIAHDLCPEAMAAATRCQARTSSTRDASAMAALVQVLGRAHKGEHEQALTDLKAIFQHPAAADPAARPADPDLALTVGEAFLQRMIHDGRYDIARKLCDLACEADAPASLKKHFGERMARLDLVGKPAPAIAANDVDGKPVSLADLKGKVVLVDFWATWCPPCVASIPALDALAEKYRGQRFEILAVNLDAMHDDAKDDKAVLQDVRRFLVKHRVTWLNLLNGRGAGAFAAAYRVEQIPANFLVGRDGRIVAFDQSGEMLERALEHALKGDQR
jgi:thiol-disulfide isomerase/thioredoxin